MRGRTPLGLYVIGHSLGGVLAQVATTELERDILAACFGCPLRRHPPIRARGEGLALPRGGRLACRTLVLRLPPHGRRAPLTGDGLEAYRCDPSLLGRAAVNLLGLAGVPLDPPPAVRRRSHGRPVPRAVGRHRRHPRASSSALSCRRARRSTAGHHQPEGGRRVLTEQKLVHAFVAAIQALTANLAITGNPAAGDIKAQAKKVATTGTAFTFVAEDAAVGANPALAALSASSSTAGAPSAPR